jgi:hypothetical protein
MAKQSKQNRTNFETLRKNSQPATEPFRHPSIDKQIKKRSLSKWQASNGDAHRTHVEAGSR